MHKVAFLYCAFLVVLSLVFTVVPSEARDFSNAQNFSRDYCAAYNPANEVDFDESEVHEAFDHTIFSEALIGSQPNPDFVYPTVGGRLFFDVDGSGTFNSGDILLPGIPVTLYYLENGEPNDMFRRVTSDETKVTDSKGSFSFTINYDESYYFVINDFQSTFKTIYPGFVSDTVVGTASSQFHILSDTIYFVDVRAPGFEYRVNHDLGFSTCDNRYPPLTPEIVENTESFLQEMPTFIPPPPASSSSSLPSSSSSTSSFASVLAFSTSSYSAVLAATGISAELFVLIAGSIFAITCAIVVYRLIKRY